MAVALHIRASTPQVEGRVAPCGTGAARTRCTARDVLPRARLAWEALTATVALAGVPDARRILSNAALILHSWSSQY